MYFKIFILCLFSCQFVVSEDTYDKVNLTYVYQARCPFCLEFVQSQFYQGYKQISDYINMEVIPVVNINGDGTIECSHGENECFISRAQACAFDRPGVTEALRVEYLHCTEEKAIEGQDVVDADIENCVNSILADIVSYETVETCMNGDEAVSLLTEDRTRVNNYGVEFVPWLAFFGVYDDDTEEQLRSDFVLTICQKLTNPPADVCNK